MKIDKKDLKEDLEQEILNKKVNLEEEEEVRGGRGRGRGGRDGRGGRGGQRGGREGGGRGGRSDGSKDWTPVTKLGRLVKSGKINSLEEIFIHSLPIKEYQIIDYFFTEKDLKDEVMKIATVQKTNSSRTKNTF